MRPGGNDFDYFKLIKLANFVQFKRMFMFCLEDWGPAPLATPLRMSLSRRLQKIRNTHRTGTRKLSIWAHTHAETQTDTAATSRVKKYWQEVAIFYPSSDTQLQI